MGILHFMKKYPVVPINNKKLIQLIGYQGKINIRGEVEYLPEKDLITLMKKGKVVSLNYKFVLTEPIPKTMHEPTTEK